jgi:hypothetical protein
VRSASTNSRCTTLPVMGLMKDTVGVDVPAWSPGTAMASSSAKRSGLGSLFIVQFPWWRVALRPERARAANLPQ